MSNTQITYLVAGVAALACVGVWIWLIAAPAWSAYPRVWQRLAASFLSLYVLVAFLVVGVAAGAAVLLFFGNSLV